MATIERIIPLLTYEDVAAAHGSTASRSISRTGSANTARAIRKGIAGGLPRR